MLMGGWFVWARTAKDPRWGVTFAWSLLLGVTLALLVGLLSPLLGITLALWLYATAWRLFRAAGKRRAS